jgi:hypothetical protein
LKPLIIFLLLFLCVSCGQDSEDERSDAVRSAHIYLTQRDCEKAYAELTDAGYTATDGRYLQALADTHACRIGYSTTTLVSSDFSLFGSPSTLGSMARFHLSEKMTSFDDYDYVQMQEAIDLLLYAGGIARDRNPTASERVRLLGDDIGGDINIQLVYFLLTQLGMYVRHYGNTSSGGAKGSGFNVNKCFLTYENLAINGVGNLTNYFTSVPTGPCDINQLGHPEMGPVGAPSIARMCQGVVLVNNLIDVFSAVAADLTSEELNDIDLTLLTNALTLLAAAVPTAEATEMINLTNATSQQYCESLGATSDDNLQRFFAFVFETLTL